MLVSDAPQAYTINRLTYPLWLQAASRAIGVLERFFPSLTRIDADDLVRSIANDVDPMDLVSGFREGLDTLVECVNAHTAFTPFGRLMTKGALQKAMKNRRDLDRYYWTHLQEINRIRIEDPIFILGFPRTGTTQMQHLLAQCHGTRALEMWELMSPAPGPLPSSADLLVRQLTARMVVWFSYRVAPEQSVIHAVGHDTFEEDWMLFFNHFHVMNYDLSAGFTDFGDWVMSRPMGGAYRYYRRQLQTLLHQRGQRQTQLLMKCPEHLWFLQTLVDVFPTAHVIWTHRCPIEVIASYASMISMQQRLMFGRVDLHQVGAHVEERFLIGVERAMLARERIGEDVFFDLRLCDLTKDPVAAAVEARRHFGLIEHSEDQARMHAWQTQNGRPDKPGSHRYSPAQFGLNPDRIWERYRPYTDRFNVPRGKW